MTEQEFNTKVVEVISNYSLQQGLELEETYNKMLCFGIMLSEQSMNNFNILVELNNQYRTEV